MRNEEGCEGDDGNEHEPGHQNYTLTPGHHEVRMLRTGVHCSDENAVGEEHEKVNEAQGEDVDANVFPKEVEDVLEAVLKKVH